MESLDHSIPMMTNSCNRKKIWLASKATLHKFYVKSEPECMLQEF